MGSRIKALHHAVYMPTVSLMGTGRYSPDVNAKIHNATAEFNTFKIVLENMLCETDIKAKSSLTVGPQESDVIHLIHSGG